MDKNNHIPVIDLFAGIGGLGLGALNAGGNLRLSVEIDAICCETLRSNNPTDHVILEQDVSLITGNELRALSGLTNSDPLVIVGGAPCQPFSKAAYWTDKGDESRYRRARAKGVSADKPSPIVTPKDDARRTLIDEYQRLVLEANADAFVFENVPSILHPRNRKTFEAFRTKFELAGYKTTLCKLNAANFGVAQTRERIFLMGSRKTQLQEPEITHFIKGEGEPGLMKAISVGEVLGKYNSEKYHEAEEIVSGKWAEQLKEIPPGWNYKALTEWAGHPNPTFVAETRFWNFLLKLSPDRPSWTIAANPGPWTGPFHWDSRRLRTPELAVLQSFPGDYVFAGNRREKVRQIGNAVPPKLAEVVIDKVLSSFS